MNRIFPLLLIGAFGLSAITGCGRDHDADHRQSAPHQGAKAAPDPDRTAARTDPDAKTNAGSAAATDPDKGPAGGTQSNTTTSNEPAANAVPVATSIVRFAAVPVTITATGTVIGGANSEASLAFPEAGRVAHVDVTVGERVAAGQTVAQLDTGPFAADAAQMRAALAAAQANYTKAAAGARPQLVAQTNAQIQGAKMQLAVAQRNSARQQQLLRLGIASQVDIDTAKTAVATAQSQLQVYQQQQSAQVQPFGPDVAAARAGVAQAQAALAAAQQKIMYATLAAPFAGIVVALLHNDGESVDPTMPVVQIAKDSSLVFTAEFAPADAQRIHRGDKASIEAQGTDDTAVGTVIAINPQQTSAARTIPVLIRLNGGGIAFGPGAYGTASITIGSQRGLVVPTAAIVSDPTTGTTQVFRKQGDRYNPVPVDIKQDVGTTTAVSSSDLHAGDVVIARGAYELLAPSQSAPKDPDAK